MSYASSAGLQRAVFDRLKNDDALRARVGDAVFDAAPPGDLPPLYVTFGGEDVRDWSDKTGHGARHDFAVQIVTTDPGFAAAKDAAGAVSDALIYADLALPRGRLVSLDFLRARAQRAEKAQFRRIELWFRALIEDSPPTTSEME